MRGLAPRVAATAGLRATLAAARRRDRGARGSRGRNGGDRHGAPRARRAASRPGRHGARRVHASVAWRANATPSATAEARAATATAADEGPIAATAKAGRRSYGGSTAATAATAGAEDE